jgi:circadian clock protein KaiC
MQRRSREHEQKRREITAQIEILQAQLATEDAEITLLNHEGVAREDQLAAERFALEALETKLLKTERGR